MKINAKKIAKKVNAKQTEAKVTAPVPEKKRATAKPSAGKSAGKRVTFSVVAKPGSEVYLAGSFNDWNPTAKKMVDKATAGVYTATLLLAEGSYEYKYVIDGTWCADPECLNWVQNDHGTLNSLKIVE